jgi:hypothetical protein
MFQVWLIKAFFERGQGVRLEFVVFGVVFDEEVDLFFDGGRAAQLDGVGVFEGERKRRPFLRFVLL